MKTLERHQWRRYGVLIVNCELKSHFAIIADFEHANVCWVHIEKTLLKTSSNGLIFVFQEELIKYQYNFMQLLNNLFKIC